MFFAPNEDQQPMFTLRGYPIYATYLIVLIYAATMVAATLLGPGGILSAQALCGFFSEEVHRGQVWRIFTYGLINPPSLNFVIDMVMIVWFGRELERFFGRKTFLRFYIALYLLTPVVLTLLGFIRPMALSGETGGFALFIAFAALYPTAPMLFNIEARVAAFVLVAILALQHVFNRDLTGLIALAVNVGFAFGYVRYEQGRFALPKLKIPGFHRSPKLRVLPRPANARREVEEAGEIESIDPLLDKIARSGMASLTAKERARLEKAREALIKKDRE